MAYFGQRIFVFTTCRIFTLYGYVSFVKQIVQFAYLNQSLKIKLRIKQQISNLLVKTMDFGTDLTS